jgi:hypothetical protein
MLRGSYKRASLLGSFATGRPSAAAPMTSGEVDPAGRWCCRSIEFMVEVGVAEIRYRGNVESQQMIFTNRLVRAILQN